MNASRTNQTYWKLALWVSLPLIIAFYVVGAAVNVPWGNTPIPLAEVLRSINWNTAVRASSREGGLILFIVALGCAVFYTRAATWKSRLTAMIAGIAAPLVLVDVATAIGIIVWPFALFGALSGSADGEFYVEDMPQLGAVGLWLLVCSILAIREVCHGVAAARRPAIQPIFAEATASRIADVKAYALQRTAPARHTGCSRRLRPQPPCRSRCAAPPQSLSLGFGDCSSVLCLS